jgi:hypothetical protein
MQARKLNFLCGKNFVYLSLINPQSQKSCDIRLISVKLPKLCYSQYIKGSIVPNYLKSYSTNILHKYPYK